jgi:hypothetical protein
VSRTRDLIIAKPNADRPKWRLDVAAPGSLLQGLQILYPHAPICAAGRGVYRAPLSLPVENVRIRRNLLDSDTLKTASKVAHHVIIC